MMFWGKHFLYRATGQPPEQADRLLTHTADWACFEKTDSKIGLFG
jgi:hypothetical protein